jgi:hypothetical protein
MVGQFGRMGYGVAVKTGLKAGAIVCYDDSNGFLMPVWTPCSTNVPGPTPPPSPDVQWLTCQSCQGTNLGNGRLSNAKCEVCNT